MPVNNRQIAIKQLKESFLKGEAFTVGVLSEAVRDTVPRKFPNVPGLSYQTHYIGNLKYFSIIHNKSGKFLVKSLPIHRVLDSVDLADHFFSQYDFTKEHDELAKQFKILHPVIERFKTELQKLAPQEGDVDEVAGKAVKVAKKKAKVKKAKKVN